MKKSVWLVSREMGGWAEAGGIKDVVRDQAFAFPAIGWQTEVVLPLYGFLETRVKSLGSLVWTGNSEHPTRTVPIQVWVVVDGPCTIHFVATPSFSDKNSAYTYTGEDERQDAKRIRGNGFLDSSVVNMEFQWAIATYWHQANTRPSFVLCHDGHTGFLPAIARTGATFDAFFHETTFALLIHNAGPGYRQEMVPTPLSDDLVGLSTMERRKCLLDHRYDPMVSASRHAKLATVSENYAQELLTGRNDHWSGAFGRFLRTNRIALEGITNGLSTSDKDPRNPDEAGIPVGFDPLAQEWAGKKINRRCLREYLLLHPLAVWGRLVRWEGPLYVTQGRLTAQKGVDALCELVVRALREKPQASFLIMAQGERRYEERLVQIARDSIESGRFLFVNKFEEPLARMVFAAGDFFLMPSEYEPCGLTDLKAQLMGTLPIVHRVGGLVKIRDEVTGYSYDKAKGGGFWGAFLRSLYVWEANPERLSKMRKAAFLSVLEDYDWKTILQERYVPWLTDGSRIPILS